MKLKPNKRTIALLGGSLVLIVLAFGGVFYLQSNALAQERKILEAKEAEYRDSQAIARRGEQVRVALEEDRAQLMFLESGVPDQAYIPTLLQQLEGLAKSTRNQVLAVRPEIIVEAPSRIEQRRNPNAQEDAQKKAEEKTEGGKDKKGAKAAPQPYTRVSIKVNLRGTYPSVQSFVTRLTRFPKIMQVEEFRLIPSRETEPNAARVARLDVELKLTAFIMKEKPPVAPREDKAVTASADLGGTN